MDLFQGHLLIHWGLYASPSTQVQYNLVPARMHAALRQDDSARTNKGVYKFTRSMNMEAQDMNILDDLHTAVRSRYQGLRYMGFSSLGFRA